MSTSEINIQESQQPQDEAVVDILDHQEKAISGVIDNEPKNTPREGEEPAVDLLNPEKITSDGDDLSKNTSKAFAELLFMGKRAESLQVTPLLNDPTPLSELKSVDEKFKQRPQISPVPLLPFEGRLRVTSPRDPTINFEQLSNRTDNLLKNVENALTRSQEATLRTRKNTRELAEHTANGVDETLKTTAPENNSQNILADQYTSPLKQVDPFSPTRRLYEEKIQTSALQVPRLSSPVYHSSTSFPKDVEVEHRLRSSQNLIASIDKSLYEISEATKPKSLSPVPSYGSLQTPLISTGLITNGYTTSSNSHYTPSSGSGVNYRTIIGDPKLLSEIEAIRMGRPQTQSYTQTQSYSSAPRESSADISKRVCSNIDNMMEKILTQNLSPKGYPTISSRLQQQEGLKRSSVSSSYYNPYQSMYLRDSMTSSNFGQQQHQHTKSYSISMDKPVIDGYGYSSAIPNRSYSPIGERKYNNLFASSTGYSTANYSSNNPYNMSPPRYAQSQTLNTITNSPPHSTTSGLNTTLHQKMGPSPHKQTQNSPKSTPPKSGPIVVETTSHLLIIDPQTETSPQKTEENEVVAKSEEKNIKGGRVYYDEQQDDIGEGAFAEVGIVRVEERHEQEELHVEEVEGEVHDVFANKIEEGENNVNDENGNDRKFKNMTFRPITEEDEQYHQYEPEEDYGPNNDSPGSKIEEMLNQQDSEIFDFDEVPSEQLEDHIPPPRYSLLSPPKNNTPRVSRKTIRNIPKMIWNTSSSSILNNHHKENKILTEGKERVPILKYVFQKFQDKEIEFVPNGNISF